MLLLHCCGSVPSLSAELQLQDTSLKVCWLILFECPVNGCPQTRVDAARKSEDVLRHGATSAGLQDTCHLSRKYAATSRLDRVFISCLPLTAQDQSTAGPECSACTTVHSSQEQECLFTKPNSSALSNSSSRRHPGRPKAIDTRVLEKFWYKFHSRRVSTLPAPPVVTIASERSKGFQR